MYVDCCGFQRNHCFFTAMSDVVLVHVRSVASWICPNLFVFRPRSAGTWLWSLPCFTKCCQKHSGCVSFRNPHNCDVWDVWREKNWTTWNIHSDLSGYVRPNLPLWPPNVFCFRLSPQWQHVRSAQAILNHSYLGMCDLVYKTIHGGNAFQATLSIRFRIALDERIRSQEWQRPLVVWLKILGKPQHPPVEKFILFMRIAKQLGSKIKLLKSPMFSG